jgi:hypothetical protein
VFSLRHFFCGFHHDFCFLFFFQVKVPVVFFLIPIDGFLIWCVFVVAILQRGIINFSFSVN